MSHRIPNMCLFWFIVTSAFAAEHLHADSRISEFEIRETAGIRRRSDVVSTQLTFRPPITRQTRFRLLHNGKTRPCQFRAVTDKDDQISAVAIDFLENLAPLETRRYQIEYGVDVDAVPDTSTGFKLEQTEDKFRISNRGIIEWTIRKDLRGLFRFRKNPSTEYVEADSPGFVFRTKEGRFRLSDRQPSRVRVTRSGPIAVALRFEYDDWPQGATSSVEMEFVRTKSWARITWTIRGGRVLSGMEAELHLALTGREKLIDFGAQDYVYATVNASQVAVLDANPLTQSSDNAAWKILHGTRKSLDPLVVGTRSASAESIAGWVHVMDQTRCSAIAVGDFAQTTRDRIEIDGTGRVLLDREFGTNATTDKSRTLEFWIHFVGMPVHRGARTSPQAMRAPIIVNWN